MGFLSKFFNLANLFGSKKLNLLIVGLDNSGKTTVIERLKPRSQQEAEVVPTVGFNVDEVHRGNLKFTVFDMSGAGRYRDLWDKYYKDAHAVIFVIDSADKFRIVVAKDELDNLLDNPELRPDTPLLVFANKQDLPTALSPVEIAQVLALTGRKERPWQLCPSNALTGDGLDKGMEWLAETLNKKH